MTESPVTYEARDGGGWITLNRPAVLNALSTELAAALADHADTAAADRRARPLVVRGAGRGGAVGGGRGKELALLNDEVSPAEAQALGLVNWVCAPAELDRTLASIIDKARAAAPTATAHTKRLLHQSFHRDPRASLEEVLRAQDECARSWEMDEANRAWREKREARFDPPPSGPSRDG